MDRFLLTEKVHRNQLNLCAAALTARPRARGRLLLRPRTRLTEAKKGGQLYFKNPLRWVTFSADMKKEVGCPPRRTPYQTNQRKTTGGRNRRPDWRRPSGHPGGHPRRQSRPKSVPKNIPDTEEGKRQKKRQRSSLLFGGNNLFNFLPGDFAQGDFDE